MVEKFWYEWQGHIGQGQRYAGRMGSASGVLLTRRYPTSLLCPLSSCASNFNSTSIFINLLPASQGDRIQTLTRISPQIDLILPHPGDTPQKRDPVFPPPFPLHFSLFPISRSLALYTMCPSISSQFYPSLAPSILHLIPFSPACLLVSQLSEQHSTSSFSVMDRRRQVLTE